MAAIAKPRSHKAGRFNVRVVPAGGLLYHGMSRDFTRTPSDYERKHVILEIYDSRYPHSALGQFVSAYSACTLAVSSARKLNLQGGVPEWTMTEAETAALLSIARKEAAHC